MNSNRLEIWQPRFKDRTVLVAKHKVVAGVPYHDIVFTKTIRKDGTNMYPYIYRIRTVDLTQYPLNSNGKVPCYVVPLGDFMVVEK